MLKTGLLKQCFKMSIQNIRGNRMRSFLTMLGIIIGVTAVISLITVVSSVTTYMMSSFASMGAGTIMITAPGSALKYGLSENDLSEIAALDNVSSISPSVSTITEVVRHDIVSKDVTVSGKNEKYFLRNTIVKEGRPFLLSDMGGSVHVCLIDKACHDKFFLGEDALGQTIRIGGIQYTVIGVCGQDNSVMTSMSGTSDEGTIYIPYRNALMMNSRSSVTSLEVYIADTSKSQLVVDELNTLLKNTFNNADNAYSIINLDSLLSTMNSMESIMTTMLAGIASIALLVGGIGIMNMMLVSVTERTKEIGLRKALGAQPSAIQLQFLLESVILSVMGGLIGIILGELISYGASIAIGTKFILNISAISLGFWFSFAVGVIFGWAPARKASQLNPIDALRSE